MAHVTEWAIMGISVMAFFILVKALASYLPDTGVFGALKTVLAKA